MKHFQKMIIAGVAALSLSAAPVMAEAVTEAMTEAAAEVSAEAASDEIHVIAMKGPTAMGMVQMMDAAENGDLQDAGYTFEIMASPDTVAPALVQGTADIAALPANMGSVIYNNTKGGVQVLAINTLGILYIVDMNGEVQSVEDLRGKTIYASGKGATPEYALDYVLQENGIDPAADVTIEWKSEHAECLAALLADPAGIAMLPQPFVTTAQMKNDTINVALDLTEEWEKLQEGKENASGLLTGITVVRTEFAQEHPEAVAAFMEAYAASVDFVNANTDEAAALIGGYDIVPEEVAKLALPACNITCTTGAEMKEKLAGYLEVLMEQNPQAVGGAVPGDDFYYMAE